MKIGFRSILARIAWLHIGVLAVASVIMPLSAYYLLANTTRVFERGVLRDHANTLAQYLRFDEAHNHWRLALPDDLAMSYARGFDGFSYVVRDSAGVVIAASRPVQLARMPPVTSPKYFEQPHAGIILFGAIVPKRIANRTVSIEMDQNGGHPDMIVDDILIGFFGKIGWLMIAITLFVIAIDLFVIRRALVPVLLASERAQAIEPAHLDLRIPMDEVPAEIRPLVQAFNDALDRLEKGFRVQREFTADAAHELRTPLSILRSRIDTFPNQDAIKPLRRDVVVMTRIVGQLLEAAELESAPGDLHEVLDLRTTCAQVVDHMGPIVQHAGQRFVLTGTANPVLINGNADMIFRAVRNLAENAAKYSPQGATIEIRIEDDGSVSVIDQGPGIPEETRELIFQRFWRRDRQATDGAGLGLSIVSKIVDLHRGQIGVENLRERGAKFILRFSPVAAVR